MTGVLLLLRYFIFLKRALMHYQLDMNSFPQQKCVCVYIISIISRATMDIIADALILHEVVNSNLQ